jgi:hypothetical protein
MTARESIASVKGRIAIAEYSGILDGRGEACGALKA